MVEYKNVGLMNASNYVLIPKYMSKVLDIQKGDQVKMELKGKKLIIEKVK